MHLTPEGLPSGMPGMGDDIDSAMQQAPQFIRHSIGSKGELIACDSLTVTKILLFRQ